MAGELGGLVVSLQADLARFESDMGRANTIAAQHVQQMQRTFDVLKAGVGAVTTGAIGLYIKGLVDAAEQLDRMSTRTGHAVEWLSQMKVAAAQNGVSMDDLTIALDHWNVSLAAAADKGSKQSRVFQQLGVDITKGPTEAFKQFAKNASAIDDATVKSALFKEMLGRTGEALIPLAANLEKATEQARAMGATISKETAEQAERLSNALTVLTERSRALMTQALEPAVTGMATFAENLGKAAERGDYWNGVLREMTRLGVAFGASPLGKALISAAPGGAIMARQLDQGAENVFGMTAQRAHPELWPQAVSGVMGPKDGPQHPDLARLQRELTGEQKRMEDEAARQAKDREDWLNRMYADSVKRRDQDTEDGAKARAAMLDEEAKSESELWDLQNKQFLEAQKSVADQADEMRQVNDDITREQTLKGFADERKAFDEFQKRIDEDVNKQANKTGEAARQLGLTFSSAFENAIVKGGDLRDMLHGILEDVLRIAARMTITEPLAAGATAVIKGLISPSGPTLTAAQQSDGSLFGGDNSSYGGTRAGGGDVMAGMRYMVGERGTPEWFVPNVNGRISNGGDSPVYIDARGADSEGMARLASIVAAQGRKLAQMPADLMKMAIDTPGFARSFR